MPAPLVKLIPTAVLVVLLGYLGWSHFELEPPPPPQPKKLPEIAHDLLRPNAIPDTDRDPFGKSLRFELGETSDERPVPGRKPGSKPGDAKAGEVKTAAHAPPVKKLTPAEAKQVIDKAKDELVLNATVLFGDRHIALINGRAYQPGQRLGAADATTPQLRVAEIHHHRVVLELEGKRMDLNYSNKPADTKPKAAQTAGRPGATRQVKTAGKTHPGAQARKRQGAMPPPPPKPQIP